MWILLAIGFLIPFIYFGYLMSKLDNFLASGGFTKESDEIHQAAIVLGKTDFAKQITELLKKNTIPVLNLVEPFVLEQERKFGYLFALSENDADNMVLCKVGRKVYGIERMISVCNDPKNEGMFIDEEIPYLSRRNLTAKIIYQVVMEEAGVIL